MLSENILIGKIKKIAFFDFCETLVSFQTADAFIDYVRKMDGNSYMKCLNLISRVLNKFRITAVFNKFFPDAALEKKIKLIQLKGFRYEKLSNIAALYYSEMIKPEFITPVIEEMQRLARLDYEICIVSAGYSIYLEYFAYEYNIKYILSTDIAFDNTNRCRGIILGKDCFNFEKVSMIETFFADQNLNYDECISYSDSISDLPLLLLTGDRVVVSRAKSQEWAHNYKFKEIIWN